MQPSSPFGVFSSTPPQFGQVCCEGACICLRSGFCLFCSPHRNDKIALESPVTALNLFSQQVDTNRPFQFQKRGQLFIRTHVSARAVTRPNSPRTHESPFAVPRTQSVILRRAR